MTSEIEADGDVEGIGYPQPEGPASSKYARGATAIGRRGGATLALGPDVRAHRFSCA
jgi:hypothetical protein